MTRQVQARLTGEARYAAVAVRHLRFMQGLCLRPDGLYRHSPLCDAPWGRGNAFPALGMALTLESLPAPDPHVVDSFRRLLRPRGILISANLSLGDTQPYRASIQDSAHWLTTFAVESGNTAISIRR